MFRDEDSYFGYGNLREFYDWILSLKPENMKDKEISRKALRDGRKRIKKNQLNLRTKISKIILQLYKEIKSSYNLLKY